MVNRRAVLGLAMITACVVSTCTSSHPSLPTAIATPPVESTRTPTAAPRSTQLSACPPTLTMASIHALATVPGADDLAVGSDGSLWVSTAANGRLTHLSSSGGLLTSFANLSVPEGIVVSASGDILLAEQGRDRIVRVDPISRAVSLFLQLRARAGGLGVDGLGADSNHQQLLIPDAAQGRLLGEPLGGGGVTVLATGLPRVVGAVAGAGGDTFAVAEASRGLLRMSNGVGIPIGGLAQLDDIVAIGSLFYVTAIDAGTVIAVDPSTGSSRVLLKGVGAPQGLTALSGNRLAVSDEDTGRIVSINAC